MGENSENGIFSAQWAVREVDHLFSRFARYTRFVLYSKWFLGVFALVLLASLIAFPLLSKDRSGIRVSFNSANMGDANKAAAPVMNNPEYRGTGEKGQQFKINGIRATQASPNLVVLEQVEAQLLQQNGSLVSLTSTTADYHQDQKWVLIKGAVNIINDKGYSFITEQARVDTTTLDVVGEVPVSGTGPLGNLLASRFEIKDNGKHLIFEHGAAGPVKLVVERKTKA